MAVASGLCGFEASFEYPSSWFFPMSIGLSSLVAFGMSLVPFSRKTPIANPSTISIAMILIALIVLPFALFALLIGRVAGGEGMPIPLVAMTIVAQWMLLVASFRRITDDSSLIGVCSIPGIVTGCLMGLCQAEIIASIP